MNSKLDVPLAVPWITNSDIKSIISCLKNPHLTDGPKLRKFESKIAEYTGCKYAIAVSNATSALYLSLLSMGIKKGDEVIIVDIDETLNISIKDVIKKINSKTKAIIPVHLAGYPCKMQEIKKISKKYNLIIIEDCAQALGTFYKNKHVGSFGKTGCFSFYPTKNITTIEGGAVITNSQKVAKKIASLRNHGITKTLIQRDKANKPWEYDVTHFGYNFRLDEIRSTLGISQLDRFSDIVKRRIKAALYYNKGLSKIKGIEIIPYEYTKNHAYHLYIVRIKKSYGISRNKLHEKLFKCGIKTTVHYKPLHTFSLFKKEYNQKDFPNTIKAFKECLSIPLFPTITKKQQDYVLSNLQKFQN
jgi:dTDP-4-amino-4,6-dideoxygalactose transaminase